MQATSDPADLFIFRRWTVSELARLSKESGDPYSEVYLLSMKQGRQPMRPIFKLRMARALHTDLDTLFATEGAA